MKLLKVNTATTMELSSKPNGIYVVDEYLLASVTGGIATYLAIPNGFTIELVDIKKEETANKGTVSESFALKLAAMSFERDTVPRE